MRDPVLQNLVEDAELVAAVGVRLGRIKDVSFLATLADAKHALEIDSTSDKAVADLQKSLNVAINDILPITLYDLKSGWTPFSTRGLKATITVIFGLFCFILLAATAYVTQVYQRATSLYTIFAELQNTRVEEQGQAIKLFELARKHRQDMQEALTTTKNDLFYENFNNTLFNLESMNGKQQAYLPLVNDVLLQLDLYSTIKGWLMAPFAWFSGKGSADASPPPNLEASLKKMDQKLPVTSSESESKDANLPSVVNSYFADLTDFLASINIGIDPRVPIEYTATLYQIRDGMNFLGLWVLPGLYGMLGAVIYHMRRLLDQNVPNPYLLRFVYRIGLGAFAGIIVVWFWTPSTEKLSQPAFATITSFGIAFLVGFSTDVFFQALDRLVDYLSQAVGKAGTS